MSLSHPAPKRTLPLEEKTSRIICEAIWTHWLPELAKTHTLTVAHFLQKDAQDWTPLHGALYHGHLDQVLGILKPSGERLPAEAFLWKNKGNWSPLETAADQKHLDQVFVPNLWTGRVGEMVKLWDHVPEKHRGQVDYEAVLQETIQQGLPSPRKWQAKDFIAAVRSLIGVAKPEGFPQTKERK